MRFVRYGLPVAFVVLGIVLLAFGSDANRYDGFFMAIGAALSILFLNVLFRLGASGDRERDAEEAARDHFARTGRWPDEGQT